MLCKHSFYYVWVWGNEGRKNIFKGSKKECKDFKKKHTEYREDDVYISKANH